VKQSFYFWAVAVTARRMNERRARAAYSWNITSTGQ